MRTALRKTALGAAALATAVAYLAAPTSPASAQSGFPCPRIMAICAYTEPGGQGALRLIFEDTPEIEPPFLSAQNQTSGPWCFYSEPGFAGQRREVSAGEAVEDFGFPVRSLKEGLCEEP
ncbi:hypothetical protein [Nonomuraea sp. B19D2]|uniref:hypothetical protein n=1 Tax=Nonomuraea sp. B19D2 TaxID=3159561 RepID=UPI0032DA4DF2